MEVSFFKRRRILRQTSALDLHPVRLLESENREEDCINLLLPRFRRPLTRKLFQPAWKEAFIRIKLDQFGSALWKVTDGVNSTNDICKQLNLDFPDKFGNQEETVERVTKFLSILYQQKFITFRELLKEPGNSPS